MRQASKGKPGLTRRGSLATTDSATVFTIVPRHVVAGAQETAPNDKLSIGSIGVGGMQGFSYLNSVRTERNTETKNKRKA